MEKTFQLHCNKISCRQPLLKGDACVTTCSHIFCTSCASKSFSKQGSTRCPACNTNLTERDEIAMITMDASENFRLTVLAGLSPDVIMDIASRSIAFYQYQVMQEFLFEKHALKDLSEKSHLLEKQLQNFMQSAQEQVESLQSKYHSLAQEFENEKRILMDTQDQYQEKCRQFKKLQTMYDKLKRSKSLLTLSNVESYDDTNYSMTENYPNTKQYQQLPPQQPQQPLHSSRFNMERQETQVQESQHHSQFYPNHSRTPVLFNKKSRPFLIHNR